MDHENADRNFSADAPNEGVNPRDLLKTSEAADYFNEARANAHWQRDQQSGIGFEQVLTKPHLGRSRRAMVPAIDKHQCEAE